MDYLIATLVVLIILNCTVALKNHCERHGAPDIGSWFPAATAIQNGRQRLAGMRSAFTPAAQLPLYQPEEHYQRDVMFMEVPNVTQRLREAVDRMFPEDKFSAAQVRLAPEGQYAPSRFEVDMEGISTEVMKKNTSYNYAKASGFVNRVVRDGYTDRVGYDI